MPGPLSKQLFALDSNIRYVAVNRNSVIVEMQQSPRYPTHNPHETDQMEELVVNPVVLEITSRRGNIDMDGIRHVIIRYGTQYQILMPYQDGHISIGVDLEYDPIEIAGKVTAFLKLPD